MDTKDAYQYLKKGEGIKEAFDAAGLDVYKTKLLLEIYERELPKSKVSEITGVQNPIYINEILNSLNDNEYSECVGNGVRITQKGMRLVDSILERL
jgi:hypothetical protein